MISAGENGRARVAVVGMGATGTLAAIQLIDQLTRQGVAERVELYLLEKGEKIGAGVAYGTKRPEHLLNMQADTMSAIPGDPGHFVEWLTAHSPAGLAATSRSYAPRYLYGQYLRQCLDEQVRRGEEAGLAVTVAQAEVTGAHVSDEKVVLESDAGLPPFDYAALCLGDLPATTFQELRQHPRYRHSPWGPGAMDGVPAGARVGIVGTSLTAVDVLLSLRAQGHYGPIVCASRRRGLPKVQPATRTPYVCRHVTGQALRDSTAGFSEPLTLAKAAALYEAELAEVLPRPVDWPSVIEPPACSAASQLRADIAQAEAGQVDWYLALDATSDITPSVWRHLSDEGKSAFLRRYSSVWSMYRHPMPLVNARLVADLFEQGVLEVVTGLNAVTATLNGRFELSGTQQRTVDYLVNATGTGTQPWLTGSPLLGTLLGQGHLRAHPLGGVDVDFDTLQAYRRDGALSRRLFFIGPLTRGVHFYTNSIETNLANAERMSAHAVRLIAGEIKPRGTDKLVTTARRRSKGAPRHDRIDDCLARG
ncbi:MAG TPA: FAD/NAD(P)-binding protein [Trebonia sp.]|nr:FAD/NAD(P)-binding protein [Trebonia sp.]